jgi:hypothetical protein
MFMNKATALAGSFLILAAVPASAQTAADPGPQSAGMYEDIEIFRRILNNALLHIPGHAGLLTMYTEPVRRNTAPATSADRTAGYVLWQAYDQYLGGLAGSGSKTVGGHHGLASGIGAEGAYLKGHGVVFHVTIPWHNQKVVGDAKPAKAGRSQWDRMRSELRGEKPQGEDVSTPGDDPTVADAVLHLLAENGKNFSHLRDDEQVTVAVTLRTFTGCAVCHDTNAMKWKDALSQSAAGPQAEAHSLDTWWQRASQTDDKPAFEPKEVEGERTDAANYLRLGELRQKQGRFEDAAGAYEKAVRIYQRLLENQDKPAEKDLTAAQDLAAKLAQVYALMGDQKRALATLSLRWRKSPESATASGSANPASHLPSKLIVAAPKRLLDQVGNKTISFEAFKKAATVQVLNFPASEKPAAPGD